MAHKTFISYKYSEAQELRNEILEALGDDAVYYQGETADSPDMTDNATETIKAKLKDMIYDTSVTIVILSPEMTKSQWIDWEIEYSLKEMTRNGRTSKANGIVGVIQKSDGGYDWLLTIKRKPDGCRVRYFDSNKLYSIINDNRFNLRDISYACPYCKSYAALTASYISFVNEEVFLKDPQKYIDNAFDKSENSGEYYLTKQHS